MSLTTDQIKQHLANLKILYDQGLEEQAAIAEKAKLAAHPELALHIVSGTTEKILRGFITQDAEMIQMKEDVRKLSTLAIQDSVLIHGESGTGKEIIAKALHGNRVGKFVAINCTSLPDYLLESELFGHKRGAFTGAVEDKPGLLHYANNGTVFLDEIGDMPLTLQAKLLRFLQEKTIRPVGELAEKPLNVRVVCATHQNLDDENRFRNDLYQRLSTLEVSLKPIRKRLEDIPLIWESFTKIGRWTIDKHTIRLDYDTNKYSSWSIDHDVIEIQFLGNVRELQKMARRLEVFGRL
jgi:two-component system response regulator PilR (NtrC family)